MGGMLGGWNNIGNPYNNAISFMNAPSPLRGSIRKIRDEIKLDQSRNKRLLKPTINDLITFVRDYPIMQTKLWSMRRSKDSRLAESVFRRSAELLSVVATNQPPLAQILNPRENSVIGFVGPDGRVASAPFMGILENIPIVTSNNGSNYRGLIRDSITFTHQLSNVHSRFKKKK
jgi:hypothetical protein